MAKYEKYAEYKDSGVNYFGEIPSDWKVLNLRYVFDFLNEKRFPLSALERESKKGIYPYYGASGIIDYVDEYLLDEETILIAEDGANLLSRSTPLAFIAKGKYWVNNHAHILKPKNLLFNFWTYFLQSLDYTIYITGSAQPKLSREKLGEVIVLYPSLEEQTQIANFLDHETAKIDSLIEKQQQLIQLLKEKRQAVISHAVTKGLNSNVPMKDSGVEWLGQVPQTWKVAKIKHLSKIISKGTTPTTMGGDFVSEGVRFLKAENIGKKPTVNSSPEFFITENVDAQLARSRLQEHDVLVIIAGATTGLSSVLQKALLPANTNQAVSFIRPKETVYAKWISYWLSTHFAQSLIWMGAVQAAQPNLSMESLGNIDITLPCVEEIQETLDFIGTALLKIDELIKKNSKAIDLMQERRTALISAAVTGKIDVRNWQNPTEAKVEFSA